MPAVNHLLRIGRTSIAHVTGPQRHWSARFREAGSVLHPKRGGLGFVSGEVLWGEWTEAWGRDAAHILAKSGNVFDAVFCGNDQIAACC